MSGSTIKINIVAPAAPAATLGEAAYLAYLKAYESYLARAGKFAPTKAVTFDLGEEASGRAGKDRQPKAVEPAQVQQGGKKPKSRPRSNAALARRKEKRLARKATKPSEPTKPEAPSKRQVQTQLLQARVELVKARAAVVNGKAAKISTPRKGRAAAEAPGPSRPPSRAESTKTEGYNHCLKCGAETEQVHHLLGCGRCGESGFRTPGGTIYQFGEVPGTPISSISEASGVYWTRDLFARAIEERRRREEQELPSRPPSQLGEEESVEGSEQDATESQ